MHICMTHSSNTGLYNVIKTKFMPFISLLRSDVTDVKRVAKAAHVKYARIALYV